MRDNEGKTWLAVCDDENKASPSMPALPTASKNPYRAPIEEEPLMRRVNSREGHRRRRRGGSGLESL